MSKKRPKLTPWFPFEIKPAYIGVYLSTVNHEDFYRIWDGHNWLDGGPTPQLAAAGGRGIWWNQISLRWRGLAEKPKAVKS